MSNREVDDTDPLSSSSSSSTNSYYNRYNVYPPYCSDPTVMASRTIPDLESSPNLNSQLEHVTVIIRHGARTPTHGNHDCWTGYWDIPQGIWNCHDLKTVMVATGPNPPKNPMGGEDNDHNDNNNLGMFYVEKVYDAFVEDDDSANSFSSDSPYKNHLNGTCQAGQLIQQGYDQQITNGKILRQRYIYDGDTQNDDDTFDDRLLLFDTSWMMNTTTTDGPTVIPIEDYPFSRQHLRYRSDDDQRTLASGQVLLESLFHRELEIYMKEQQSHNSNNSNPQRFPPIIDHHTADRSVDIFDSYRPHNTVCNHILNNIRQHAHQSTEFQQFNTSREANLMRQLIQTEFSNPTSFTKDCIMTTICTDRPLPKVLNDYTGEISEMDGEGNDSDDDDEYTRKYGRNRFVRLRDYFSQKENIVYKYNDSEYSKVDMSALWMEIFDQINPVLDSVNNPSSSHQRLSIFSGHDSTLIPLMASLGQHMWNDTDFPDYASMMIIEIHRVSNVDSTDNSSNEEVSTQFPSGFAFRLVYNGRVVTWLVDPANGETTNGCQQYSHLCDISVLIDRVMSFATRENQGCGNNVEPPISGTTTTAGTGITDHLQQQGKAALSIATEMSIANPNLFFGLSLLVSFTLGMFLTLCCSQCICGRGRQSRGKQRRESELVLTDSNEEDEPDIVID